MKKKTAILLVGALALTAVLSGCGKNKEATEAANESVESEDPEGKAKNSDDAEEEEKEEEKETAAADKKVGVFLPSAADDSRWALDGESLQTALEGDGYDAEIFFADEDSDTQVSQIQSILDDEKTSALVIAPVDAYGLNDVLEFFYNGVMEKLQEYFDDGTLVCTSGKQTLDDTAVMRSGRNTAKNDMAEILSQNYTEGTPDIICTGADDLALGAVDALEDAGHVSGEEGWPMITGCGCEAEAVTAVIEGKLADSLFFDNRVLASDCVTMVDTLLKGEKPEISDYEQYDNGTKIVGTVTSDIQLIDADNYQMLVDDGYYDEDEIVPEATPTLIPTETPEVTVTEEPDKEVTPTPSEKADEEDDKTTSTPSEEAGASETPTSEADETATPTPTEKPSKGADA